MKDNWINGNDFIKNDWVQVSPNPTNGRVVLDFKAVSSTVDVLIYNAVGQKINQLNYQGMERIEIDLPSQNGVYLFDIRSDNQRVIKKVVKN